MSIHGRNQGQFRRLLRGALCGMAAMVTMGFLGGCLSHVKSGGPVATDIDPQTTLPSYWWKQQAYSKVYGDNFEALWGGAERAVRNRLFTLDRQDYRDGVLTTAPMVSKQNWEFWRRDVVDKQSLDESSLATVRRTVRFEIIKRSDGGYVVEPRVLVERLSLNGKRITAVVNYTEAFAAQPAPKYASPGEATAPTSYWYAIGRDTALEKELAEEIADWVIEHPQG